MKTFSAEEALAGPPSACSSAPNRLDVFAVMSGGTVRRWSWDGTTWDSALLPAGGGIPAEGICAVSSGPGRVEVFAAEQATRTPVWWRGENSGWNLGAPPFLPQGALLHPVPVAAVCASPDNIDVFAAGDRNTPWWWHWNGSSWTPASKLPEGASVPAVRIAAVSPAPGRLDVFAVGASNHLWHWWKEPTATSWSIEDLGGDLPAVGVNAVSWGGNRIDVFAASRSNTLQHWWWQGGAFSQPEDLGGNLAPGTVSAISRAADRLDIFGLTRDQSIAHVQWDGQDWIGPTNRGDHIPAGDVTAVSRAAHRLDVFVTGAGNVLRQWPGGGLENAGTGAWSNLATNRQVSPIGRIEPDSVDELVNIVQEAERLGREVRAVGSSWSNSDVGVADVTPTPAYIVETHRLNGVLADVLSTSLNGRGSALRLVHVEAGIKLYELNDHLDRGSLALKTLGGATGQSLAGVLSTSTHGMDIDRGPIPDMVRAIHLVGPGGVQHWIEPAESITDKPALATVLGIPLANIHYDDDWFNSVLVSMGSLGIIYSVIVEVDEQYDLYAENETLDWTEMKTRLGSGGGPGDPFPGNRGVGVVIYPYPRGDGSRTCSLVTRQQRAATAPNRGMDIGWLTKFLGPGALRSFEANNSTVDEVINGLTGMQQGPGTARGWAHTMSGGPDPGAVRGLGLEIAFDATNTRYLDFIDAALEILRVAYYLESPSLGYLGWISVRFQGQSRAYLSMQHAFRRTCTVEFAAAWRAETAGGPAHENWPPTPILLARLEDAGRRFGGIQHWGMFNDLTAGDVARAYPDLNKWRRVRWALTQGGTIRTFDSDFTRRCGLSHPPRIDPADYDGDGRTDFAVWGVPAVLAGAGSGAPVLTGSGTLRRPGTTSPASSALGTWYVLDSTTGARREQQWGQRGDIPVPGDYDGDGRTDFAVWRPSNGVWYVIDSSTGETREQQWGQTGDIPVPGDYDGDGRTDFAVWRPSNGVWYVIDSSTGETREQQWGQTGDVPVPGDYDGDGRTDFAVWGVRAVLARPGSGVPVLTGSGTSGPQTTSPASSPPGTWYVLDRTTGAGRERQWGERGDIPVPGDYDGDGRIDFAVWRPSNGVWYVIDSFTGETREQQWGQPGDVPVPGDYDGDGWSDFAVWRPSNAVWYVIDSSTGGNRALQWGQTGDIPVLRHPLGVNT